mgnify:FL=1
MLKTRCSLLLFCFVLSSQLSAHKHSTLKLCLHLSNIIGRPVLLPISGTVLSRIPKTMIDTQSNITSDTLEEYRYLDSKALQICHVDKQSHKELIATPDTYCFDQ